MKLKDGFLVHDVNGEHMAVAAGKASRIFNGLIRNNDTADFIYRCLLRETSEQEIVDKMEKQYDAPKEQIAADVEKFLGQLRTAGFLDE